MAHAGLLTLYLHRRKPFDETPLNLPWLFLYLFLIIDLPSGSAINLQCPLWIPFPYCSTYPSAFPAYFICCYCGFNIPHEPELFKPSCFENLLCDSGDVFCTIHHSFEGSIFRFPPHFRSSFWLSRASHDHVLQILGGVSTRVTWWVDSGYFSSVQIRLEADMLASYLHDNAALRPFKVSV